MKTRVALLLGAALMSVLAVGPPPAKAARGMEVAVQDDLLFLHRGAARGQYFSRDTAFDKVRAMHGSAMRVNLVWAHAVADSQVALKRKPARVRWDWPAYDSLVDLARAYGVKVQFSLTGPAPAWGTQSRRVARGYFRPRPKLFAQFARAAARHFRGRVNRYSIWNEPNWDTWLAPQREAAARYRVLYRRGYRAVKRADRRAKVFFGELVPYDTKHSIAPLKFLRQVTCVDRRYRRTAAARRERRKRAGKRACAGGTLKADAFAHHPYEFKKPPRRARSPNRDDVSLGALGRLTRALDKLKRSRALVPRRGRWLPLYLTEFGYFRAGKRRIAERKRARWTVQGFKLAQRHPRVKQLLYYVLVRPPGGTFFDLSLIDHDGRETRTYRALVRWSRRAAARGQIKRPGRKVPGVIDSNPPPPPTGGPPPPDDGDGGGTSPPPDEPACPIPLDPLPCAVPSRVTF